ncbi:hypothetical protein [Paenibacillus polymyxa]|uniref:hypothetical protein n=1 Tax=Paenibacillus polymyxa TaxID=1406 RepID=UPI002ED0588E|nr:hypothetical protein [Paenibacillus polymyxa]
MSLKKQIKSIIDQGIARTNREREIFDQDFSRISKQIADGKSEMKERAKKRRLIQNK